MERRYGFHCYVNKVEKIHFATAPGVNLPLADAPRLNLEDLNEVQEWLREKRPLLNARYKVVRATERYQIIARWSGRHEQALKLRMGSATTLLQLGCYLTTILDAKFRGSSLAELATGNRKVATKNGIIEVSNLEGFANPNAIRLWFDTHFRALKQVIYRFDAPIVNDAANSAGDLQKVKKAIDSFIELNVLELHDKASQFLDGLGHVDKKVIASDQELHITFIALSCLMSQLRVLMSLVDVSRPGVFERTPTEVSPTEVYRVPVLCEPMWTGETQLDAHFIRFCSLDTMDRFVSKTREKVSLVVGEVATCDMETGAPAITDEGVELLTTRLVFDILEEIAEVYADMLAVQKQLPYLKLLANLAINLAAAKNRDLSEEERTWLLFVPSHQIASSVDLENDERAYSQLHRQTARVREMLASYLDRCYHRVDTPIVGGLDVFIKTQGGLETIYRVVGSRPVMRFARSINFETEALLTQNAVSGTIKQKDFVWHKSADAVKEHVSKGPSAFEWPGTDTRQEAYLLCDIDEDLMRIFRRSAYITCSYIETEYDALASTVSWTLHTNASTLIPPSDGQAFRTFGRKERRLASGELFEVETRDPLVCDVADLLTLWRHVDLSERTDGQLAELYAARMRSLTSKKQVGYRDVRMADVFSVSVAHNFGLYVLMAFRDEEVVRSITSMLTRVYLPISISECLREDVQLVKAVDLASRADFEFKIPLAFVENVVVEHWKSYKKDFRIRVERDGQYHITLVKPQWIGQEDNQL